MRMIRIMILFLATGVFFQIHAKEDYFESGIRAFRVNDYPSAISHFEQEIKENPNHLTAQYNLAIMYYKNGQKGKAILFLERYLRLAPGDREALDLLYQVNMELNPDVEYEESLTDFSIMVYGINSFTYAIFSIVIVLFAFGVILYNRIRWKNEKAVIVRLVFYTSIFVSGIFIYGGYKSNEYRNDKSYGIVTISNIPTFSNIGNQEQKMVAEGGKVKIIGEQNDFYEVKIPDGTKLNIRKKDLEII